MPTKRNATGRGYGRRPVRGEYWAPWVDDFDDWLDALVLAYEFEQALKAEEREREQQQRIEP